MEQQEEYKITWTTIELANHIGSTSRYIVNQIRMGEIKAEKRGRDWHILDSEVKRWLAEREARRRKRRESNAE